MPFNATDNKYKCCCCLPVKWVVVILTTLETILVGGMLYKSISVYVQSIDDPSIVTIVVVPILVVFFALYLAAMICIYISLCKHRRGFILPKIILILIQLLRLIILFVIIIFYFLSGASTQTNNFLMKIYEDHFNEHVKDSEKQDVQWYMRMSAAGMLMATILLAIYNLWFLRITRAYYHYIKEQKGAEEPRFQPLPTSELKPDSYKN